MPYVFDGYSEASSARNSPEHQGQPPAGSRRRRRERDGPVGGAGPEGMYFGTGRFYEENLRNEEQRRRERDRQQTPRQWSSTGHFDGGLGGSGFAAGGAWSEEEWGPAFVEALRRARERRWQGKNGGNWTAGLGVGGGARPHGFGDGGETRFDDLFGGVFGAAGGGSHGDDGGGETFGARAGGSSGFGFFGGGGATNFEGMFGSPGGLPDRAQYGAGAGAYFGFGDQEDVRRGGAGMTWAEFTELFRHRYDGGRSYGYAGGRPPADLFDSWHTDW
ncbi:hypothetical protein LX32DRAFT_685377 [Colletotrichum zoysiae]|uniref:Uncharacterized protein n=1 Tax=Colletotrichum zoysiae TaxID=1216348 RepID=A0AAD9LY56_9PEZI|nr:hypothetical protein LX32DRAFT_685377 [Colletotrichum zoysiae]